MERWEELQSRLLSHFRNAASIIQRLQVLKNIKNYDSLNCVNGIGDEVLMKQMASLQNILISMNKTFPGDLSALQQLLVDQPNIPIEEGREHLNVKFS